MLQVALDHLASLDNMTDDYIAIKKYKRTGQANTIVIQQQTQPTVERGKIELPRNIVDRAIDFLRTPFPTETKQKLRYMRAVLP